MDMREISAEIRRLEQADTNYKNCEKLATLYTVKNNNMPAPEQGMYSRAQDAPQVVVQEQQSDFVNLASSKDFMQVLGVLDKHMELIAALYPREYEAIMVRLARL